MAAVKAADQKRASFTGETEPGEKKKMELLVYEDCVIPGLYEDVMFPIAAIFCKPEPPSSLPPRFQMPRRPGPVFKNDLSLAGEREEKAQRTISAFWRGILCRRRLHNDRTYKHVIFVRARRIQCCWRSYVARKRFAQNKALKEQWIEGRREKFVKDRIQAMANTMMWQRTKYEGAAITIQRVVRWHLSKERRWTIKEHPESEGETEAVEAPPEPLPYPLEIKPKRYFPWRSFTHAPVEKITESRAVVDAKSKEVDEEGVRRRTILHFKKNKDAVEPPNMEEVREQNRNSKARADQRAWELEQPEVLSRLEWKREGLRNEDLDFNAAIIQRLFRTQLDSAAVRGETISLAYMCNTVRIIAATFRMYTLIRRLKRNRVGIARKVKERRETYCKNKIDDINIKMVWGKELLDQCATTIQKCWHYYRFKRFGVLPLKVRQEMDAHRQSITEAQEKTKEERRRAIEAGELDEEEVLDSPFGDQQAKPGDAGFEEPSPPPYNLIAQHLERERQIKDALMNELERDKLAKVKNHKYVKYIPENPEAKKKVGVWIQA